MRSRKTEMLYITYSQSGDLIYALCDLTPKPISPKPISCGMTLWLTVV